MKGKVLHFTPKAELGPAGNVQAFVELCRNSEVLHAREQFNLNAWDTGHAKGQNKKLRIVYSTLEAASRAAAEPALPEPFLSFAKAMLVYLQDQQPVKDQSTRLAALRCMEAALRELTGGSRPTAVDEVVLDQAVARAKAQVSNDVVYAIACQLRVLAKLMQSKGFISLRRIWDHDVKKRNSVGSRISKDALEARQQKLPSAAALRAIGGIFQEAVEPCDVIVSSCTALMVCAPERVNEVLRLRRNCLVEGDGEFRGKLGLRWAGSKGFADAVKWLPSEMAPIAREAVGNLVRSTTAAHEIAAWYTSNRKQLYLHEGAVHLRGRELLTKAELALILWGDESLVRSAKDWAKRVGLANTSSRRKPATYRFKDVEQVVLAMLPSTFPYVPGDNRLLCRDAIAISRRNELHPLRPTFLCMFTCIDYAVLHSKYGRDDRESIFQRFGYTEDDGSPIALRSHSLRHYLNMLAQTGGLTSAEIALFSGRKDVRQNRAYDHMTSEEVQVPVAQALSNGFTAELEPLVLQGRNLVSRSEFGGLGLTAAHTTEFGWCAHDFASEPCQVHRDCINCEEQECIKGDEHKEANLRLLQIETRSLLAQARVALSEVEYGADIWVRHQTKTLDRINALLAILEDGSVPIGARIRLDGENARLIGSGNERIVKVVKTSRQKGRA